MISCRLSSFLFLFGWGLSSTMTVVEAVKGKGPVGVHPINERYIAVADSSIDAVLIVDSNAGGSVVGHFVLHNREKYDPSDAEEHIGGKIELDGWVNPLGLSTCDACDHVFVTSPDALYRIKLERPLVEMAETHDFSSFSSKSSISEFWPDNWNTKFLGDGKLRMISVAPDGSSAYVTHARGGVFSFDPMLASEDDDGAAHAIHIGDAGIDEKELSGIHHTQSLKHIVLTSGHYVHFVNISDDDGNNPLDRKSVTAYKLPLDYHCSYLYSGENMYFFDTAIINEYAFVLGHPHESSQTNGVAVYRLTWDKDNELWHDCIKVAGSGSKDAGWQDGFGEDARFSLSAHDIAYLPSMTRQALVVGDVGNHALRYVDVTMPVETGNDNEPVRVTSVSYDENLWYVLYRDDAQPEDVMKIDGKSYYESGEGAVYEMTFEEAQEECVRAGTGKVCSLPEIRARFARGQFPSTDGDDGAWTTVWTNESCGGCHLAGPGTCPIEGDDVWGADNKLIANFSPKFGLVTQCTDSFEWSSTMSMCCGLGGPGIPEDAEFADSVKAEEPQTQSAQVKAEEPQTQSAQGDARDDVGKEGGLTQVHKITMGVTASLFVIAVVGATLFAKKRYKPSWWPRFFQNHRREETGHAPHREVDLRGRDYI